MTLGKRLAYCHTVEDGEPRLVFLNPQGGNPVAIHNLANSGTRVGRPEPQDNLTELHSRHAHREPRPEAPA